MAVRLARGHLNTPSGRAGRAVAVDLLMKAVRRLLPQVLREFADEVHHPATRVDGSSPLKPGRKRPVTHVPSPQLCAWATRWHLASTVVYEWAFHTAKSWERYPERRTHLSWEIPAASTRWDWSGHTREDLNDPLAPVGAVPELEHHDEFKTRAEAHWQARVNELDRHGFNPAKVKTNLDHFEWLARYQCGGESLTAIARSIQSRCEVVVVTKAVAGLATQLQLNLRPHAKGGRPRKHTNRKP